MPSRRLLEFLFCYPLAILLFVVAIELHLFLADDVSPRVDAANMLHGGLVMVTGYCLFLVWALRELGKSLSYARVRGLLIACPLVAALLIVTIQLLAGLVTNRITLGGELATSLGFSYGLLAALGYGYVVLVGAVLGVLHLFRRQRPAAP